MSRIKSEPILFIAPSAYPLGGVQTWLDYLLPGLANRGWRPVLGLTAGQFHDVERYLSAHPWPKSVAIPNPTGSNEGRIRALIEVIQRVRPQLALSVNIPTIYAAVERLRARGEEAPHVVMTNHSVEADYLGDARAWASVLDGMIGTNRLTCRLAEEYSGLEAARVYYAPYGVDVEALGALLRPPAGDVLRIAWVGRLEQDQKRIDTIPAILTRLDRTGINYRLLIAGDGPKRDSLLQTLQPWIQSGNVEYLGSVPSREIGQRVYAQADVLLLTSSWETGPIVIWEAMAAGTAVVSSRYIGSGLEGALQHEKNCLMFTVGDAEGATDQLMRLSDANLRATIAAEGQRLVAERYSINHSVRTWSACLDVLLQMPSRPLMGLVERPKPAGRLDRLLGVSLGESVRRTLSIRFAHTNAGGEWPHTEALEHNDMTLLEKAARVDALLS